MSTPTTRAVALATLNRLNPGDRVTVTTGTTVLPLIVRQVYYCDPWDVSAACVSPRTGVMTEVTLADLVDGARTIQDGWYANSGPRINPAAVGRFGRTQKRNGTVRVRKTAKQTSRTKLTTRRAGRDD